MLCRLFDLKSHNVLLTRDGTGKIADVGLAKVLTQVGNASCSGAKMPPTCQHLHAGTPVPAAEPTHMPHIRGATWSAHSDVTVCMYGT